MQNQSRGKPIEILFHRSVRRTVSIRTSAEAPCSNVLVIPQRPCDTASLKRGTVRLRHSEPRIIRLDPPAQPDWRIVGDNDPELVCSREEAL